MERDTIVDPANGRFVCAAVQPWVGEALRREHRRAVHPDAELIGAGDYYDDYLCPWCDHVFRVTVAEDA